MMATLRFPKRPKAEPWLLGTMLTWRYRGSAYKVMTVVGHGLPPVYRAEVLVPGPAGERWDMISRHRKLSAAERACARHAGRFGR